VKKNTPTTREEEEKKGAARGSLLFPRVTPVEELAERGGKGTMLTACLSGGGKGQYRMKGRHRRRDVAASSLCLTPLGIKGRGRRRPG